MRQTAVSLLQRHGERQENIWHAKATALYASRFVDIEAKAADAFWHRSMPSRLALAESEDPDPAFGSGPTVGDVSSRADSSALISHTPPEANFGIPEHLRIAEAQLVAIKQNSATWSFHRKPNVFNNNWESWEEHIELG